MLYSLKKLRRGMARIFYLFIMYASCVLLYGQSEYDILGLKRDASREEIRKTCRALRAKYHPDKSKEDPQKAHDTYIKITNACDKLLKEMQQPPLFPSEEDPESKWEPPFTFFKEERKPLNNEDALFFAVSKNNIPSVKALLAKKVTPNLFCTNYEHPDGTFCIKIPKKIVVNNRETYDPNIWIPDNAFPVLTRAVEKAIETGNEQLVDILINAGADINAYNPKNPESMPLYSAIRTGSFYRNWTLIPLLIQRGASVSQAPETLLLITDFKGKGYEDIVKMLVEYGAKVNVTDGKKNTPLHNAVFSIDRSGGSDFNAAEKIVRLLVEHGADINAKNKRGNTPLKRAQYNRESDRRHLTTLLLDLGANINIPDEDGRTILWDELFAEKPNYSDTSFITILLDRGARVDMPDVDGKTIFDIFPETITSFIKKYLQDKTAKYEHPDAPIFNAIKNNNMGMLKKLFSEQYYGHYPFLACNDKGQCRSMRTMHESEAFEDGYKSLISQSIDLPSTEIFHFFMGHGVKLNDPTLPLFHAIKYAYKTHDFSRLEILLKAGSNVNESYLLESSEIPLSVVLKDFYNENIIKLLLDYGANPYLKYDEGKTIFDNFGLDKTQFIKDYMSKRCLTMLGVTELTKELLEKNPNIHKHYFGILLKLVH